MSDSRLLAALRGLFFAAVVFAGLSGCAFQSGPNAGQVMLEDDAASGKLLENFWNLLVRVDEFGLGETEVRATTHLNNWILKQRRPPDWNATGRLSELPTRLQVDWDLEADQFDRHDFGYLQQAKLMRDAADWIPSRPAADPALEDWLATGPADRPVTNEELTVAVRLFDWTVRNVQLDEAAAGQPILNPAKVDPAQLQLKNLPTNEYAAGTRRLPWEALLAGHGDAIERARVFIALLRQRKIPAAALAVGGSAGREVYAVGALVGGGNPETAALYLFDPLRGVPLPGPDGRGVARWADLKADPSLVRQLDLPEQPFPVDASNAPRTFALVDAPPTGLSRRMAILERNLTGDRGLALTVNPDRTMQQLSQLGLANSRLWSVPFEASFAHELRQEGQRFGWVDVPATEKTEQILAYTLNPLTTARRQHLAGEFTTRRGALSEGAKRTYLTARNLAFWLDEAERRTQQSRGDARLEKQLQPWLGFLQLLGRVTAGEDEARQIARSISETASFWLGVAASDTGDHAVAARHFERRVIEDFPDGRWKDAAEYNLGRAREALGETKPALAAYNEVSGPSRLAAQVRVRRLTAQHPPAPATRPPSEQPFSASSDER